MSQLHSRASTLLLIAATLALPAAASAQQGGERFTSIRQALAASSVLRGDPGPEDVNWINGGRLFSFTAQDPQTDRDEIRLYDPATGRDSLLFEAGSMDFPGTSEPFEYHSFQWSHDSKHLVFQTHFRPIYRNSGVADFYVYNLADRSLTLAARGARTAELSPDGSMIGYERDGHMFVYDMAGHQERQLTDDTAALTYDGHFDWVYEEEFGQPQAWNWSPDSRYIAFWRTDAANEPVVQISDLAGRHPQWERLRIPQPGDSNAIVKIGVVDVHSGHTTWLDPGLEGDYYIPRIYWTSAPDTLAVMTLNRPQNEMRLYFFDVNTGGKRLVFTQKSDTWIDVFDFYAGVNDMIWFPAGLREFFWISDRTGFQHIYRYSYSGRLLNAVTKGDWSVTRIEGIDVKDRTIFYTSTEVSPLQRQLYSIRFDGRGQRRVSHVPGTHHFDMSPDTHYYIDSYSSIHQPLRVELWSTRPERRLRTLESNPQIEQWLATHAYSPTVLFSFTTPDSVRLDASMVRPVPFDPTHRYPVVMAIYGGPGSQEVYDAFDASGWDQWLAQHGYIVVGVNNRGTNNYGSAFMKIVYRHLGRYESRDFAATAHYLATLPYVDAKHMAIMGTSYGGYSTCYTMTTHPGVFALGIANSPVTDWRLYDTIYTERYMGLLSDNEEGYRASSCVEHAAGLQGRFLLVHSLLDDNVHPQNTMQFLTALDNAGKDVDVRLFPPGAHGAFYSAETYVLGYQIYNTYLARFLKGAHDFAGVNER